MSFENMSFNELDELAVKHLIFDTNELNSLLKGHLFIERVLDTLVKKALLKPELLFNQQLTFSFKVNLAASLGVLPEEYWGPIKALNKIRNNYVHDLNYQVTPSELNQLKLNWEQIQHEAYDAALTKKGIEDTVLLSTLFLCWATMKLLK